MANKKRHRHYPLIILIFILLLTSFLLYDSNVRIVTSEYILTYENLPDSFIGFRIVQLSDVHAAHFGDNNEKLISAVKAADPDLIAITGDLIDLDDQGPVIQTLIAEITQIAPVYYVTGNNEWPSGGLNELFGILEEYGVIILQNEYVPLSLGEDSIIIAGVDDPNGPADMMTPHAFIEKIRETEGEAFIVLLAHRNNRLSLYSALDIDLVLCGHAHGGLIRLPFTDGLIGPSMELFPTYTNGLYSMGTTNMIVSRGLGNHTGIPRFLNNPHLPVIILKTT